MPASIEHSEESLRIPRARKSRPINVSISNWRRLSFGYRSVPPATNIARGPSSAAIREASRAVFGRRYLNLGSLNTEVLRRWLNLDRRRVGDGGKRRRPEARGFAFRFATQRLDNLFWG